MTFSLDTRPLIVALAGPNGAGKSTFFLAHLQMAGLRFVNADDLARELNLGAYEAAELANQVRHALVASRESFVFETVFSDPGGEKLEFLSATAHLRHPFRKVAEVRDGKAIASVAPEPSWLKPKRPARKRR